MKRMATLLLIIGLVCIGGSIFLFSHNKPIDNHVIEKSSSNKQKGNMFEDYVIQYISKADTIIRLKGKVSDYNKNGVFADENFEPDLKFSLDGKDFSVECKWRNKYNEQDAVFWSYPEQIKRYNSYQKENKTRVFIAIGVGGTADKPADFYLVPLYRLTKEYASKSYIEEFRINERNDLLNIILK